MREPSFEDTRVAFAGKTDADLRKAQMLFLALGSPWIVAQGSALATALVKARIPGVASLVRATLYAQFCGGETIALCDRAVTKLGEGGVKSILDYSVEGEESEAGFDATAREILATIEWAPSHALVAFSVFKVKGLARHELLEKRSAGGALSADEQAEWGRVEARVESICARAEALGVPLFIDAEETWVQKAVDELALATMQRHNRARAIVYTTVQMYRRDALGRVEQAVVDAGAGGYHFGVKLVRGAYLEKERARAAERGYPDPMQPDKASTDADYDAAVRACLENLGHVALCAGTHNEASCLALVREMDRRALTPADERVCFSQLYGMSDHISFNLASLGYRVTKYLPYGPVASVLPYLVRRAQENTAIAGQRGRELRLIDQEIERRRREG
jgi:proline dehydrogenase